MRVTIKQLMDHLGIDQELKAYQTDMHQVYDPARTLTCSAEARMGPDQGELECEILMFNDVPEPGTPSVTQILLLKIRPKTTGQWAPSYLKVKKDDITNKYPGWDEDACKFYAAVTLHLKRDEIPDIDALIDEHLDGEGGFAGRGKRGGGRKSPKFKPPTKTLNMKQGM